MLNINTTNKSDNCITQSKLCMLSCETIFKYDFINHHKIITKAKRVIDRNKKVVDSFNNFLSEFESRFRGMV